MGLLRDGFQTVRDWIFPNSGISKTKSVPLAQGIDTFRALNTPTIGFINKEMGNPDNAPDPNWASNSNENRQTIGDYDRQNKGMPPKYIGTGEYRGSPNNPNQGMPDPQTNQVDNSSGDPELRGLSDNQLEDLVKSLVTGTGQAQPGGIFDRAIKEKSRRSARAGRQPYESYRGLDRLQNSVNYDLRAQQEGARRMRDAIDSSWAENERLSREGASLQMMENTVRR